MCFKPNICQRGRMIRGALGVALLVFAGVFHSYIALALALFCFFQAYMSWCVFCQLLDKHDEPDA